MLMVENLQTHYGAIQALRGISFSVRKGQVVALIGANGVGKSTTLNTISGLLKPAEGRVQFDGRDITGWRPHQVTAAGLVQAPEGRAMLSPMTVQENLELGAYTRSDGDVDADLKAVFARFPRLAERRAQSAGSLSGGEQQMLAIGRALMARPKLLMLDEPSMGLAPLLVRDVFRIIAEIGAQGVTVLLVEQNAKKALELADYAYVLDNGRIVHEGDADDLQQDARIVEAYLGKGRSPDFR